MYDEVRELVEELASTSPAPAAGAAAALSLSQGAAVALKAIRITRASAGAGPRQSTLGRAELELDEVLRQGLFQHDDDCRAVKIVMRELARPTAERDTRLLRESAMGAPGSILRLSADGLHALSGCAAAIKPVLSCEVTTGGRLMRTAASIANDILRTNERWLSIPDTGDREALYRDARNSFDAILETVEAGMGS